MQTHQLTPATDALRGAKAIAEFLGENVRRTNYLLETRRIPAGKIGSSWMASRATLAAFYARLAAGQEV